MRPGILLAALLLIALIPATRAGDGLLKPGARVADSTSMPCDSVPELNRLVVELAGQQLGTTVARGECWDLAALVLNRYEADWDKQYRFGRKVNPAKECVYPGDIIQFEGVVVKYRIGNATYTETMAHHTAMVYAVKSPGVFTLIHQNTGTSGRKVGLSDLDLKTIVKGKYIVYRPVR